MVAELREEWPLARLSARRGRDQSAFLAPAETMAGERLRADFTRGGLMPSVTQSWDRSPGRGERRGAGDLSDNAIDARGRVNAAVEAVGPELSGLLLDVCCFLKGLETVERERQWPSRSAKLLLKTGLAILARHYGYESQARGREGGGRIRAWGTGDHRPRVGGL